MQLLINSGTMILNIVACVFLIYENCGIHMVKLVGSLIFVLRPMFMSYYVNRHYKIDLSVTYKEEPISQKWYGIAQHFSAVALGITGTIVLTCFSTLIDVSIYTVYNMIVFSIAQMVASMGSGVRALIGDLWVRRDIAKLKYLFAWTEWIVHTGSVFTFGCTMILVMPFVLVYTKNIVDADYARAMFAILITLANLIMCIRIPYHIMIQAAGHYKETQRCYIIAILMNSAISMLAVLEYGLIGVAIGTLCAMCYQTVWMVKYISKNLIKWPIKNFGKQFIVDSVTLLLVYFAACDLQLSEKSYLAWCIMMLQVMGIVFVIQFFVNILCYRIFLFKIIRMAINKIDIMKAFL